MAEPRGIGWNQGKGAAVAAGILASRGEYLAFLDADLATAPHELKKGFALLDQADLAIASRRVPKARFVKPQTWYRSLAGQAFNLLLRLLTGLPYRDTQCGCKTFRREIARDLFTTLTTTGWAFDVELLQRARQKNYRVAEFPVAWINGPVSRVHIKDAVPIWHDLWRLRRLAP